MPPMPPPLPTCVLSHHLHLVGKSLLPASRQPFEALHGREGCHLTRELSGAVTGPMRLSCPP
jgi:hypothetical protein